ncbi:MAG: SGNH/GDSL hydrolase family protein [Marinicellaceae bacterium]
MIHLILTILLGPILIIQGIWVRRKTIVLPEPQGCRSGIKGSGKKLSLLIIGDSAAAGVGTEHQDYALSGQLVSILSKNFCVNWELKAQTGHKTQDTINQIKQVDRKNIDIIITSLGVNDVTANLSLTQWLNNQNQLFNLCRHKFKFKKMIVTALPPMSKFPALPQPLRWYLGRRSRDFNLALKQQVSLSDAAYFLSLDMPDDKNLMASDGFHPGEKVYKYWAKHVADVINQIHNAQD